MKHVHIMKKYCFSLQKGKVYEKVITFQNEINEFFNDER